MNAGAKSDGPTIRLVVGEDSYLAAEGIRRILERAEVELLAVVGDFDGLVAAIDEKAPDVVLTDIRMPPSNSDEGVRLAAQLRLTHPTIGVVLLSQHVEPAYAAALFEDGSAGRAYLLKERVRDRDELMRAIRAVADGESVVDPAIVEALLGARQLRERFQLDALTHRELEVLAMIAQGSSNAAIAETLVITKKAVERHINGIFAKLNLGDPTDVDRRVKAALLYLAGREPSERDL